MTFIPSTNPSLWYEEIWRVEETTKEQIKEKIIVAKTAQNFWKRLTIDKRVSYLKEVYDLFDKNREKIGLIFSKEMGMPITQTKDEIQVWMDYFKWYLENAKKYLSPEITHETDTEIHTVYFEPKWIVLALSPWNYPFFLFIWSSMQALLAWNAVMFKTSKETILTWKLIDEIIQSSSLPKWIFTEIFGPWSLAEWVLREESIDFITFTWSTKVWKILSKVALERGIWCVMELWWSAPGIIFEDADLDKVIETIYFMRYSNSWQMCDWLKRLIVHKSRYKETIEKLIKIIETKKIWVATSSDTDIWPLASKNQLDNLQVQYNDAIEKWAEVLYIWKVPKDLDWAYFPPVILWNIDFDMKVWKEEVFGPVLPVVTFETIDEAIELANDTIYGLWAYVFTEDKNIFNKIAPELQSWMVQLNTLNYCIPASPFGWYKDSWIWREHWRWWFGEFTNIKVTSKYK